MKKLGMLGGAIALIGLCSVTPPAKAVGVSVGTFSGTIDFNTTKPPLTGCATVTATFKFDTYVTYTNGSTTYAGPLTLRGSGWGNWCGGVAPGGSLNQPVGWASGTDEFGHDLFCPELHGMNVEAFVWTLSMGQTQEHPCTLDGAPLHRFSMWLEGAAAGAVVGLDGVHSAVVAGMASATVE